MANERDKVFGVQGKNGVHIGHIVGHAGVRCRTGSEKNSIFYELAIGKCKVE